MTIALLLRRTICSIGGLSLTLATAIRAETRALTLQPEVGKPVTSPVAHDLPRWNVQLFGTGLADVTNRDVAMGGATVGIGYYVFENLAINAEFTGYHVDQDTGGASAFGASIGLRHHVLELGNSSLFIDVGGGFFKGDDEIPPAGTTGNTTFCTGVGMAHPIGDDDDMHLISGVRYFHLSNADREGDDRNPSINAVQGFVGVMIRF